jgi:RNA polymerase sigma-70 factor (ECF subfamily)
MIRVYWKRIYAQALSWLRSASEAEELTQDVFVRVWASREKLEQVANFDSWLFVIARNTILDGLRKKLNRPDFVAEQDMAEKALRPDEQLESRQHYACLMKGISLLPAKRQQVFRLSRLEGLTHAEIAERLGMHKDTVAQYIVKAAAFLRGYLQEHLGDSLVIYLLLRLFF